MPFIKYIGSVLFYYYPYNLYYINILNSLSQMCVCFKMDLFLFFLNI